MSDSIKITMLGTTGAGKTCYMLGMYAAMEMGFHGFTFSASNSDDGLKLNNMWEKLLDGDGDERWPLGTDKTKTYNFSLNHGFRKIMGFEWQDYRGGALNDDASVADVSGLIQTIHTSSCLFLCISGEYLRTKVDSRTQGRTKANRMNMFITELVQKQNHNTDRPLPVAIVITQYDLCSHRPKEEITEDIKRLFQALFTPGGHFLVMICPVSLGKKLSSGGELEPVNVHLPVFFAIYSKFCEYGKERNTHRDRLKSTMSDEGRNWLMRWINKKNINKIYHKV